MYGRNMSLFYCVSHAALLAGHRHVVAFANTQTRPKILHHPASDTTNGDHVNKASSTDSLTGELDNGCSFTQRSQRWRRQRS
jgi:hypothetical protein